jgi:hypothetical protein
MREHRITFTFTGSAADNGRLDGSDRNTYSDAARQFLAVNAHFYATGRIPKGPAFNHTKHYRVWSEGIRVNCYAETWIVATAAGMGAVYGVRLVDYLYEHLLRDTLQTILGRKPSVPPPEMRREPYFAAQDNRNAAVFDDEAERLQQWERLRERSTLIIPQIARPIGRTATKLVIAGEEKEIATIDADTLRKILADVQAYKEAAITAALDDLGLRQRHLTS